MTVCVKATLGDHCFKEILWLVCWEQGSLTIPSILNYDVMFILWGLYLAFLLLFPFLGSVYFWFLPFPTSRSPSSVSSLHSLCIPSSSPSSSSGSRCLSSSPTPPKTHFIFWLFSWLFPSPPLLNCHLCLSSHLLPASSSFWSRSST